jgi:hypothetical protein
MVLGKMCSFFKCSFFKFKCFSFIEEEIENIMAITCTFTVHKHEMNYFLVKFFISALVIAKVGCKLFKFDSKFLTVEIKIFLFKFNYFANELIKV